MILINMSELASICGITESTALAYYYRELLPEKHSVEKAPFGRKVFKWLIDDVMVYARSTANSKPISHKVVDFEKVKEMTEKKMHRAEMAKILKVNVNTIDYVCAKYGIWSKISSKGKNPKTDIKQNTFNQFLKSQHRNK